MPLHLLGKKSWNVYNPKNIERVKHDEEAAKAREEAEEQRQQEVDAERRLAILRGEVPPPLPPPSPSADDETPSRKRDRDEDPATSGWGKKRRKRKRAGEDDTDFELRLARDRAGATRTTSDALVKSRSDAPLTDHTGHIDLFPDERSHPPKNEKTESEAAKKKRENEDQYTMRFSNAAGKDGLTDAWYTKGGDMKDVIDRSLDAPSKDVWGNEDPRRKEREVARVVANDPLAMMKRGAAKVREVEKERRQLNEERGRELKQLRKEEKKRERRRRREGREDYDDLEGFTLDGATSSQPPTRSKDKDDSHRHRHRKSRDESSRSRRHSEHRRDHKYDERHNSESDGKDRERNLSKHDRRREGRADNY
ncbi:uncharacterized protein F4822DRAFT_97588 [Hypoxylon trugodes]|uniref:uncharacterized protein n=1 Tax=Hypoxylon trugodes TaxID=326681 RepID=UPI00219F9EA4|nr:uncharacterized protein F4822DRAFT_97588 [Hypoxylon trugodes]KAI1382807.1 hypothetical protein F4822DRAFT_97588 [Hypoxylon trugodes]